MTYATIADLRPVAAAYGVALPDDADALRALELASHDLDLHLVGTGPVETLFLTVDQLVALTDATAIQAAFRLAQGPEMMLALDDGVASLGVVSFSMRPPQRLSPEAAERVAGMNLLMRSGCAPPPLLPLVLRLP